MIDKSINFEHIYDIFCTVQFCPKFGTKGGLHLREHVEGGGAVGGHTTFRILSLLRYVVDIGKSSPNPKFF